MSKLYFHLTQLCCTSGKMNWYFCYTNKQQKFMLGLYLLLDFHSCIKEQRIRLQEICLHRCSWASSHHLPLLCAAATRGLGDGWKAGLLQASLLLPIRAILSAAPIQVWTIKDPRKRRLALTAASRQHTLPWPANHLPLFLGSRASSYHRLPLLLLLDSGAGPSDDALCFCCCWNAGKGVRCETDRQPSIIKF